MMQLTAMASLIALIVGTTVGWHFTSQHYQLKITETELAAAQKQNEVARAYAERVNEEMEKHDENQAVISRLRRDASRVRVHIPAAPRTPETCPDQNGAAGVFSEQVNREFEQLQREVEELAERCDQLNIDAIRLNGTIGQP